jgi:hypothetical protein
LWAAAITWGLTISQASQKRWGMICVGLFALTFIAGMVALIAGANLDWNDYMNVQQKVGHGS